MLPVADSIRASIAGSPEGAPVTAKQFLHLGTRAAVDQALSRLCRRGELLRAARGVYVRPVTSRFGVRAPAPERVVAALAAARGETVAPSGAASANALGLTPQVPTRTIYLTSGPSRRLRLGAQTVELHHAPPWVMAWPQQVEGLVIRALAALGPAGAAEHLELLRRRLTPDERQRVAATSPRVPSWMAPYLTALANG